MNLKLVAAGVCAAVSSATSQSDSVAKTLLTRKDAEIGVAAVAAAAGISWFDPKIAAFFADTSLAHVRAGERLDNAFTHVNETTLTLGGIAAYGVGRLV